MSCQLWVFFLSIIFKYGCCADHTKASTDASILPPTRLREDCDQSDLPRVDSINIVYGISWLPSDLTCKPPRVLRTALHVHFCGVITSRPVQERMLSLQNGGQDILPPSPNERERWILHGIGAYDDCLSEA